MFQLSLVKYTRNNIFEKLDITLFEKCSKEELYSIKVLLFLNRLIY